ncbi:MAG: type II toxin-antitoxin system YafQ family toxin [Pigmentiphaga sp.]|nr:type II toxin-antitoxin system YafQ family toxin [Pigmentiphaga sp.]
MTGQWSAYRECHVGGDFLLIYQLDDAAKAGLVVFVRTSDLDTVRRSKYNKGRFGRPC